MEECKEDYLNPGANPDLITVEDCIEMYERKEAGVVLEDGQVTGFVK